MAVEAGRAYDGQADTGYHDDEPGAAQTTDAHQCLGALVDEGGLGRHGNGHPGAHLEGELRQERVKLERKKQSASATGGVCSAL